MDLFDYARRQDPPTSKTAAVHAKAISGTAKTRMYQAFLNGPKTANEAAAFCKDCYPDLGHETYRKRTHELRRAGLIQYRGTRICGITGHGAEVWEVV